MTDRLAATWVCIENRAVNTIGSPCGQCGAVRLDLDMAEWPHVEFCECPDCEHARPSYESYTEQQARIINETGA